MSLALDWAEHAARAFEPPQERARRWATPGALAQHLDRRWSARFAGLTVTHEDDGTTRLSGPVTDQAALHGILATVRA